MKRLPIWSVCALVVAFAAAPAQAGLVASSTFDSSMEGWSIVGDANALQWFSGEGNPPGCVGTTDQGLGGYWYYVGGPEFQGNLGAACSQSLKYDIWVSASAFGGGIPNVVLESNALTLELYSASPPAQAWTTYTVPMDANAGWVKAGTSDAPTQAEMQAVLADLDRMLIRGEYTTGDDYGRLDNVIITPEPTTLAMLGLGACALIRRRR